MKAVYRNLTEAKRDPRRFVWSVATPAIRADGTVSQSSPGKAPEHVRTIALLNPRPVIKPAKLRRLNTKGIRRRDVGAWIVGTETTGNSTGATPIGTRRLITMNPLTPEQGGRNDLVFSYCRVEAGTLVIEELVEWSEVKRIEFTPEGCFALFNQ